MTGRMRKQGSLAFTIENRADEVSGKGGLFVEVQSDELWNNKPGIIEVEVGHLSNVYWGGVSSAKCGIEVEGEGFPKWGKSHCV